MEGGPHLKMSLLGEKSLSTDALDGTSELYLTNSWIRAGKIRLRNSDKNVIAKAE
jgi:hypothetical protein